MQSRTGHLRIRSQQTGKGLLSNAGVLQRRMHALGQRRQIRRNRRQHATWIDQQLVRCRCARSATYMNRKSGSLIFRQTGLGQPGCIALDTHACARQQVRDETLAQFQISQGVTARRVEQAGAETQFAAGGDRGRHTQAGGHFPGHDVHAAQTAEQRDHRTAVLGDRQDRRLGALLQQHRRQAADHDASRAQGDDRRVLLVELAQGCAELAVSPRSPGCRCPE